MRQSPIERSLGCTARRSWPHLCHYALGGFGEPGILTLGQAETSNVHHASGEWECSSLLLRNRHHFACREMRDLLQRLHSVESPFSEKTPCALNVIGRLKASCKRDDPPTDKGDIGVLRTGLCLTNVLAIGGHRSLGAFSAASPSSPVRTALGLVTFTDRTTSDEVNANISHVPFASSRPQT